MKIGCLLIAGSLFVAATVRADEVIEDVMKQGFKGKESIAAKIGKGEASGADKKKMAELVAKLVGTKPPQGEPKSWTEKIGKLNVAAKAIAAGKTNADELWKAAANCKECHKEHKPEDKK